MGSIEHAANDERREYPFETDVLDKGSIVTIQTVEGAYGVKFGTDEYQLAALRASAYIERRFRERGLVVTVVQRKGNVHILTDQEAAEENRRQFDLKLKGAARAHVRNVGVDRGNLPEGDRAKHDRSLETQGRQLAAMRQAKKLPTPTAHQRTTPLIPSAKKEKP